MRKNFLTKNYSLCWKFLQETKWYVVFAFGVFAVTFLIGFAFPIFFKEQITQFIIKMSAIVKGKTTAELIFFIILNNIKASFMAIIFGVIFGVFPLITSVANGYLLGFVARGVSSKDGISIMWKLLPHGIFELPAVMFSIGIGIKIGLDIFRHDAKRRLKYNLKEGLRFFIFVVLPLLIVAGIIEGTLIHIFK